MPARDDTRERIQWRVLGVRTGWFRDIYPRLMGASWTATIAWAFAAYTVACLLFALGYALEDDGVSGTSGFMDLLWFSLQTLSTIGYGGMTPLTPWANLLVMVESFAGLAGVAVVTAILYAKFSLPAARVQFSSVLAIHDRGGVPTLHLRMLNERTTPVLDASLHLGALVDASEEGESFRRFVDLPLVRSHVPMFAMVFTVMHTLDDDSPLHAIREDPQSMTFMLVTLRGVDARTLQPVFARAVYEGGDLAFGVGFDDMVSEGPDGIREVDATRLDRTVERPLS